MLITSRHRRVALNVPVLFGVLAIVLCFGAGATIANGAPFGTLVVGVLVAGALVALALSQLRWIRSDGERIRVRTAFGVRDAEVRVTALGIDVHHSPRSGPTYTVYADDGDQKLSLAETLTDASAVRARERLRGTLIGDAPQDANAIALQRVSQHEARWRAQQAEAVALVGGPRAVSWSRWAPVAIGLGLLVLGAMLVLAQHFAG